LVGEIWEKTSCWGVVGKPGKVGKTVFKSLGGRLSNGGEVVRRLQEKNLWGKNKCQSKKRKTGKKTRQSAEMGKPTGDGWGGVLSNRVKDGSRVFRLQKDCPRGGDEGGGGKLL